MILIFYRMIIGVGLLLVVPTIMELSNWNWHPRDNEWYLKVLFLISKTAGGPWGSIITQAFLYFLFLWYLKFNLRSAMICFWILFWTMLIGQGIKSWMKIQTHKPRPFVAWFSNMNHISTNEFYSLKRKEREVFLSEKLSKETIPPFLLKNWQKEVNFSFPSGHTIFSVSWTLLGVSLLWPYQKKIIFILFIWTNTIMWSRMLLGMHWPKDLIVAILISSPLTTISTWLILKHCQPLNTLIEKNEKENAL